MERKSTDINTSGKALLQIEQIAHLLFHRIFHLADKKGLHPGQLPLIYILRGHDGLSPKELRGIMHIRPSTITVMVQRMERSGFIERRQDGTDQRRYRIYLTEKGEETYRQLESAVSCVEEEMLRGMTEEDRNTLHTLLAVIRNNLLSQEENRDGLRAESRWRKN